MIYAMPYYQRENKITRNASIDEYYIPLKYTYIFICLQFFPKKTVKI